MTQSQSTPRHAAVRETIHGVDIVDPFRWLEQAESPETQEWVAAENAATRAALDAIPGRAALTGRLSELLQVGGVLELREIRGAFFFTKRDPGQDQPVLRVQEALTGTPRVVVDPVAVDPDGLTSLDWWYPSPLGALLCFGLSRNGDEWSMLHVLRVATGELLVDRIPRARYASVAWLPDESGFYYTRYPEPGTVPPGQEHYNSHLFFHRLGDDPASDPEIFGQGRAPEDMIEARLSADGRWLVASAFRGWSRSEVYLLDRVHPDDGFKPVAAGIDAIFTDALVHAGQLFLLTNLDAPN
jgi:prolyl oligopeptidase